MSVQARALFLLAALVILAGIGLRDPWPADEPRFALVAKTMVESGDWLIPRRGSEIYAEKPPLFMWAIAAVLTLTGSLPFAFLLPSALAGLGTLWLVYDLARRLWSERVGVAALLGMLAAHQFIWQSRTAQIDAFLCFWTALGFYGFMRHLILGPAWRWYWLGSLAVGLGVISKGVGFLPWLALLPYAWLRTRGAALPVVGATSDWRWLAGLGFALVPVLAWLLPLLWQVAARDSPELLAYRDNILFRQTGQRYLNPWHHHRPFWYLFYSAITLWLPLVAVLPWLMPHWWRAWRQREPRVLMPLIYMVLILLFFSLSPGKRGVYILPALPAFVLAAAPYLPVLARSVWLGRLSVTLTFGLALLLTLVIVYAGWLEPEQGEIWLRGLSVEPWGLLLFMASLGLPAWLICRHRAPVLTLPVFYVLTTLCWGFFGMPMLDNARSARPMMAEVVRRIDQQPLALVGWREPLMVFAPTGVVDFGYSRSHAEQLDAGLNWLAQHPNGRILGSADALGPAFNLSRQNFLGRNSRQDWYLVGRMDLMPGFDEVTILRAHPR